MSGSAREHEFARCSQRWAAAHGFRSFRTAQQDEAATQNLKTRIARIFRRGGAA